MSHNDSNERERRNDHEGQERRDNATPGVIGGAALIGAGIGALISGPLVAIGLGATAAGLCLSDNKVEYMLRNRENKGGRLGFVDGLGLKPGVDSVVWALNLKPFRNP